MEWPLRTPLDCQCGPLARWQRAGRVSSRQRRRRHCPAAPPPPAAPLAQPQTLLRSTPAAPPHLFAAQAYVRAVLVGARPGLTGAAPTAQQASQLAAARLAAYKASLARLGGTLEAPGGGGEAADAGSTAALTDKQANALVSVLDSELGSNTSAGDLSDVRAAAQEALRCILGSARLLWVLVAARGVWCGRVPCRGSCCWVLAGACGCCATFFLIALLLLLLLLLQLLPCPRRLRRPPWLPLRAMRRWAAPHWSCCPRHWRCCRCPPACPPARLPCPLACLHRWRLAAAQAAPG